MVVSWWCAGECQAILFWGMVYRNRKSPCLHKCTPKVPSLTKTYYLILYGHERFDPTGRNDYVFQMLWPALSHSCLVLFSPCISFPHFTWPITPQEGIFNNQIVIWVISPGNTKRPKDSGNLFSSHCGKCQTLCYGYGLKISQNHEIPRLHSPTSYPQHQNKRKCHLQDDT